MVDILKKEIQKESLKTDLPRDNIFFLFYMWFWNRDVYTTEYWFRIQDVSFQEMSTLNWRKSYCAPHNVTVFTDDGISSCELTLSCEASSQTPPAHGTNPFCWLSIVCFVCATY